jgi:hypothetical protein
MRPPDAGQLCATCTRHTTAAAGAVALAASMHGTCACQRWRNTPLRSDAGTLLMSCGLQHLATGGAGATSATRLRNQQHVKQLHG